MSNVRILEGDLLKSNMHALVNTVNTVGIMGKGVALAFKKRYPDMYRDYVKRCDRGEVRLGEPYVYRADDHVIVNFPTKQHWRSVSRLNDIEAGALSASASPLRQAWCSSPRWRIAAFRQLAASRRAFRR